jgi:hypothetical protein
MPASATASATLAAAKGTARDVRPVLDLNVLLVVELIRHLAGYPNGVAGWIEAGDLSDAALATDRSFPKTLASDTVGTDRTDTRYRYPKHDFDFRVFAFNPTSV